MTINLSVLPLDDVVRVIVPQKCLLPSIQSSNLYNCGNWVRCKLDYAEKQIYVVCQIYGGSSLEPESGTVYLDRAVTVGVGQEEYSKRLQGSVLVKLELLEEVYVDELELTIIINMDFFHKMKKTNLLDIVKFHLQAYCMTNGCTVRSEELKRIGITAIDVSAKCVKDELQYFRINDETRIKLIDVHLQDPSSTFKLFHTIGYEMVLQQLNELVDRPKRIRWLTNSNALIVGSVGCGKSAIIEYFVQKNNCNYFHISSATVLGQYPGEAESKIREIFSAARIFASAYKPKAPIIIHLEDLHLLCPDVKAGTKHGGSSLRLSAQLNSLLESLNSSNLNIHCLATTTEVKLLHKSLLCPDRFQQEINIDPLNKETRRSLFQLLYNNRLYHRSLTDETLENVVARTSGYVVSDLDLLVRSIEQRFLHNSTLEVTTVVNEMLAKAKPASIRAADVSVVKSVAGFDAIGGMKSLKDALRLNVLTGLTGAATYKRFGLSLPKGILLYGPPGCAKTTIAKCLAGEAKMTFIATSSAEVYSPYVGCAEKFITKLFDTARKHAPCLLFLDEIDTLLGCRVLGRKNANDVQTRILSTLLTEMDGIVQTRTAAESYILLVAATNRPNMIDDALLRPGRFDQLIHVPAPDRDSRLSILELHKQNMPFAADIDLLEIAERTHNFSGADICNLCNEAAMNTLLRDMDASEITASDFHSILRKQKPSLSQRQIDLYFQFQKGQIR